MACTSALLLLVIIPYRKSLARPVIICRIWRGEEVYTIEPPLGSDDEARRGGALDRIGYWLQEPSSDAGPRVQGQRVLARAFWSITRT